MEVNIQHHTRTCKKDGCPICRFFFSRFPTNETLISVPAKIKYKETKKREEILAKSKCVSRVKNILINDEDRKELDSKHPVDIEMATDETYLKIFRKKGSLHY